jgi:hypothetical protein
MHDDASDIGHPIAIQRIATSAGVTPHVVDQYPVALSKVDDVNT